MNTGALQNPELLQLRLILAFVQPFFGATILMCFYLWLHRRQAKDYSKDDSLVWLSISLLICSFPRAMPLIKLEGQYTAPISFFFSPLINILFTVTAFKLLRVKEAIKRHKLEKWAKTFIQVVVVFASATLILNLSGWLLKMSGGGGETTFSVGANIDVVTSCIALITLGLCVSYSFYKYGNQPLIVLTLLDFGYLCWYQINILVRGGKEHDNIYFIATNITSLSTMMMLFIALTLAWGLSNTSRLRFKDSELVEAIVMFLDIRGSTEWVKKVSEGGDNKYVVNFMNKFSEWIYDRASEAPYGPPVVKPIGDGFMFVWEVPDNSMMISRANAIVGLGCALCSGYLSWVESTPGLYKDVPSSIGIGVDFGSANRLTLENGSYDYLGLPLNYAAKMQALARPDGGVVIRDNWKLSNELYDNFSKKGKMIIGDECIPVRATKGVKLRGNDSSMLGDIGLN